MGPVFMDYPARIAIVFAWLALSSCAAAAEPSEKNVAYATIGEKSLLLDIYRPTEKTQNASPLILWIHGGAWRGGAKEDVPVLHWLAHGFAIASIDYRLSPEAGFPAQVHDIKAAVRFLRANADHYGFDGDRFAVAGASAGGHLAALVGVSNGVAELEGKVGSNLRTNSDVQAIVSFYGASNLETILSQSTEHGLSVRVPALQLLLGGLPQAKRELARLASPVAHVDASDPPLWLVHGDADPQMPIEQSRELQAAYAAHGLPVLFEVIAGGKHGGEVFYTDQRLSQLAIALNHAFDRPSER